MPLKTKIWASPTEPDDGLRILICRYRPRGLPKAEETWNVWMKELGPSPALHAAFYGKDGPSITLDAYRERYVAEMAGQSERIQALADRLDRGESLTLLCSTSCLIAEACHRSILAELIAQRRRE